MEVGYRHVLAVLHPGNKNSVSFFLFFKYEAGRYPQLVLVGAENLAPNLIRSRKTRYTDCVLPVLRIQCHQHMVFPDGHPSKY